MGANRQVEGIVSTLAGAIAWGLSGTCVQYLFAHSAIDSLLEQAGEIAQMNNRCSSIDLTQELDPACGHFYTVDLPEFEAKYLQITGEARLNAITVETEMNKREEQIHACTDALLSIAIPKEQLIILNGSFTAEPLPGRLP